MAGVVMAQKLVLEFGHVHIRGAFGFTCLALQTQVEHVVQSMAGEFGLWQAPCENGPQGIGPPAGRMLLVACRHVRWTHGRTGELAALAIAIAHVDGGSKAAVAAEVEIRLDVDGMIGRPMTEILTWRGA